MKKGCDLICRRRPKGSPRGVAAIVGLTLALVAPSASAEVSDHFQPPVKPGTTSIVSLTSAGTQPKGESGTCDGRTGDNYAISDDGRYVAFASNADALTPDDTNGSLIQDVFVKDLKSGKTELITADSRGLAPAQVEGVDLGACGTIKGVAISGNGRFVAFSNLVPLTPDDERLLQWDVFLRDRKRGETELVSVSSNGTQANGDSGTDGLSLSDDGRMIAFTSAADNLDGDLPPCLDVTIASSCPGMQVFVHDGRSGETSLVSRTEDGSPSDGNSQAPNISGNGRYVAFHTTGRLVAADLNTCPLKPFSVPTCRDVYVYDLKSEETELISVNLNGVTGNEASMLNDQVSARQISDDGRFVSFFSQVTSLVPSQGPVDGGVFLRDRDRQRTDRVDVTSWGSATIGQLASMSDDARFTLAYTQDALALGSQPVLRLHDRITGQTDTVMDGWHAEDWWPALDGRGQAFIWPSADDDLVSNDTNDDFDLFVHDWGITRLGIGGLAAGTQPGSLVEKRTSVPAMVNISDEVADVSVAHTSADIVGGMFVHRPALRDLYLRIDVAAMAPFTGTSIDPFVFGASFSVDGERYEVRAQRSLMGMLSPSRAELGLFTCAPRCELAANLSGGYGTVGESIVLSVPVRMIGLGEGGRIQRPRLFSGPGIFAKGVRRLVDTARPR